ncbi:MAG: DUF4115 domain-containing protein, partial [Candidatus Omnitrophica bacterium]|nr:DUF4115 domain-containing protein [Candidatus Omnitrophota bacterium]
LGLDPKDQILDYKEVRQGETVKSAKDLSAKPIKSNTFLHSATIGLRSFGVINKKPKAAFVFIVIIIILSLALFNLGRFISSKRKFRRTEEKPRSLILPGKQSRKEQVQKAAPAAVTYRVNTARPVSQTKAYTPKQISAVKEAGAGSALVKKEAVSGIRLGVRARENCWISLKVDGHLVFQRVLEKGRFESWQAKDKIEFSLSNAAAVELEVNGQLFSNLGRRGQPRKNILITKEGLNIAR